MNILTELITVLKVYDVAIIKLSQKNIFIEEGILIIDFIIYKLNLIDNNLSKFLVNNLEIKINERINKEIKKTLDFFNEKTRDYDFEFLLNMFNKIEKIDSNLHLIQKK